MRRHLSHSFRTHDASFCFTTHEQMAICIPAIYSALDRDEWEHPDPVGDRLAHLELLSHVLHLSAAESFDEVGELALKAELYAAAYTSDTDRLCAVVRTLPASCMNGWTWGSYSLLTYVACLPNMRLLMTMLECQSLDVSHPAHRYTLREVARRGLIMEFKTLRRVAGMGNDASPRFWCDVLKAAISPAQRGPVATRMCPFPAIPAQIENSRTLVRLILDTTPVDVNAKDSHEGLTALIEAITFNPDVVPILLTAPDIDVDYETEAETSALESATGVLPDVTRMLVPLCSMRTLRRHDHDAIVRDEIERRLATKRAERIGADANARATSRAPSCL